MSNKMVERVGEAIAHRVNCETFELGGGLKRAVARAAIEAMMEPTRVMLDEVCSSEGTWPWDEVTMKDVYKAMIQAALKEEE